MTKKSNQPIPKFVEIEPRKLVGQYVETSISLDVTINLWKEFMSRHKEIVNRIDSEFYSVQVYPEGMQMSEFTTETSFERWAAVEVSSHDLIPDGMNATVLKGGLYAVFTHVGSVKEFVNTSNYIYGTWLPNSEYELDSRAHFELLGDKYLGHDHPESEEEIWIPIKAKS